MRSLLVSRVAGFCASSVAGAQLRVFDRLLGVSTRDIVCTGDSVFTTGADNCPYEACQWLPVRRVLRDLAPGPSDVFVDFGSGKGKALLIAGRLPYRRVVGIEIDEDLSAYSERNVRRARSRLRPQQVDSVAADVLEWPIPDDASVFFMYNPFVGQTFRAVAARIFESYDRRPRNLHIVYVHPWEHDWLLSTGRVVVEQVRPAQWPPRPRWWHGGLVIVSYRVVGTDSHGQPRRPRRMARRRRAIRHWSRPNGHRFEMTAPGHGTVYSRS